MVVARWLEVDDGLQCFAHLIDATHHGDRRRLVEVAQLRLVANYNALKIIITDTIK